MLDSYTPSDWVCVYLTTLVQANAAPFLCAEYSHCVLGPRVRKRAHVRVVPGQPVPRPGAVCVPDVPRQLAPGRPRERLEHARVRVRGGLHERICGVRAVCVGRLQARAWQRHL